MAGQCREEHVDSLSAACHYLHGTLLDTTQHSVYEYACADHVVRGGFKAGIARTFKRYSSAGSIAGVINASNLILVLARTMPHLSAGGIRVQTPAGKAAWVVVGQNVYGWRRRGADQSTLLIHAHALDSMDCEQRCKKETNGAVSHQVNPAMSCTASVSSVIERVRQIVGQLARRDADTVGASVRYFPVPTSMRIEHALRRIHSWRCDEPEAGRQWRFPTAGVDRVNQQCPRITDTEINH